MAILTLFLISLGVAMDAVAVSASAALTVREGRMREALRLASTFGVFQAVMAAAGWAAGAEVIRHIAAWDHWIAFVLLALIGGKMIREGVAEEGKAPPLLTFVTLLILGVATSIDSLAVGLTLPMLNLPLVISVGTIGLTTFALSLAAALGAQRLGASTGGRLEILGGVVLIAIGLKILIEHLAGS